ncbi:MAG: efflux RND transporter periplasmic adaptor subunit [Planctomycetes bacterium]|nr:efflux RND transporter periplasmic adaptor subunit [Planctomycetota bacterium]
MDLEPLRIDRSRARRRPEGGGFGRVVGIALLVASAGLLWVLRAPALRMLDRIRLPVVRTVKVTRSDPAAAGAVSGLAANGYVVAARRAALSADTPGRIVELHVTEGSVVEKGQLVARLLDEEYVAALEQRKADLEQAKAILERTRASLASAQIEVERNLEQGRAAQAQVVSAEADRTLAERELTRAHELRLKEINTPGDLDRAIAAHKRAEAGVVQAQALESAGRRATAGAEAGVKVAEAELSVGAARIRVAAAARDQAAATLRKTEVRAPFSGIVVLKDAEVGEVVSPNSVGGANARGSVATLVDFASLEIQADLPEASLAGVRVGAPAQVFLDAYPGQAYPGKVSRIWPTANRSKATIEVRVKLDKPDDRLRPEMGVRVVFSDASEADSKRPAKDGPPPILLPEEALVTQEGSEGTFVLERDVVSFVDLRLGERRGGQVIVLEGLKGGELVVIGPPLTLSSGDRVRLEE